MVDTWVLLRVALKASARQTTLDNPVDELQVVLVEVVVDKTPVMLDEAPEVPGVTVESPLDLQANRRAVAIRKLPPVLSRIFINQIKMIPIQLYNVSRVCGWYCYLRY
jgi:hypothetical protein